MCYLEIIVCLGKKNQFRGLSHEPDVGMSRTNVRVHTYHQRTWRTLDVHISMCLFLSAGFAVVLLVLYYLQRGCTPPLLPSVQALDPSHFSTTSGASATAEKLSGSLSSLPFSVRTYRSRNNDTLGNLLVGFFNFYCQFDWYRVISVRLADTRNVPRDKKWTRPYIRIEDPFDCKNVTRAVYQYPQFCIITGAIRRAKQQLANSNSYLNDIL